MRSGLLWIVLLIAAVIVGWIFFGGADDGSRDATDGMGGIESGDEDADLREADAAPVLKGSTGSTADRPLVPVALRGRGMIQGVARRAGNPVVATVALRHVQEIDPRDPFKGGMETQFITRLLDAGMSSKAVIARVTAGEDGIYKFRGLAPGLYEIRATAVDGAVGFAAATLPALGARVEASVDLPAGSLTLNGRVTYADGTAFRGLVLAAQGDVFSMMMGGGAKSQPAQTDAEGRFKLAGLAPGGYQLSAMIPGVMRVMGAPIKVPFDGEYALTINATGIEVIGKVLDAETEKPIAGAKIFGGGGDPSSSFAISSTKSDAEGGFTMTLPAGRGGGMFVRADGYAGQTVDFQGGAAATTLTVTLLRLSKLTGRVTAQKGGAPVAGITVFAIGARGRGMMPSPGTAITDAEGRYTMEGVDPGALKVHAIGAGFASVGMSGAAFGSTQTPYAVELEPGAEGTLDLEAIASGAVKGRVLTEAGAPIPGAVVSAQGGGGSAGMAALFGMGSGWGTAVTDSDGAYTINVLVPGTEYTIFAKAPDHPDASSSKFTAEGGKTESVDVHMKEPRWLEIRVVDAQGGKPIVGATIRAVPKGNVGFRVQVFGGGSSWTTDADGRAKLGPLPQGEVGFLIASPGYIPNNDTTAAEGKTTALTVELKRGLVIAGRLQVPDGVPLQSVRVTVQKQGSSDGWYHKQPPIQADGSWRVDDLEHAGEYKISGRGQWKDLALKGEVRADSGDEDVVLVMEADASEPRSKVEVTVLDQEGKRVPAGRVQLWGFTGKNSKSTSRARLSAGQAVFRGFNTDAEVWVEVFELIGTKRGAILQGPVTITGGKLEVRLGRPMSIAGSVTGDDDKAVGGVKVTATAVHPRPGTTSSGREHGTAVSNTDGRFEVKGLGNLEYTLSFQTPPDYTGVPSQKARAGASGIAVRVKTGVRATLTVLDHEGKPVAGAWVTARKSDGKGGGRSMGGGATVTGGDGTLTLRGLEPGVDYDLSINGGGDRSDLKSYSQKKWRPADVIITLKRALQIRGKVVDQHGKPASGMTIRSRKVGAENWSGWARTGKDGAFVVKDLEAGRYEVKASGGGMVSVARPSAPGEAPPPEANVVQARAGATGVKITIDRGLVLTVTLRGGEAPERGQRSAVLQAAMGAPLNGTWKDRKTIEFQGLVVGATYTLWVSGLDDGKYATADGIEADARKLTVQAEAGGVIEGRVKLPAGVALQMAFVRARSAGSGPGATLGASVDLKTGTFRLEGAPHDVEFTLWVHAQTKNNEVWQAQGKAASGANVSLELKKRETK